MAKDYTSETQAAFYVEQERLSQTRDPVLLRPRKADLQLVRKEFHPDGMPEVLFAYDSERTRKLAAILGYAPDNRPITEVCAEL